MTKELQAACEKVQAHIARRALIDEKLSLAEEHRNELIGLEADAKARLGQVEAESDLEPNPQAQADAKKSLLEIRDEIEVTEARIEGLKSLAVTHDGEFEPLRRDLEERAIAERKMTLAPLNRRYRELVEHLSRVVMQVQAAEFALGIDGPHTDSVAHSVTHALKDLENGNPIVHMRHAVGRFAWQDDPEAAKTLDGFQIVRDTRHATRREATAISSRNLERRNAERRAEHAEKMAAQAR